MKSQNNRMSEGIRIDPASKGIMIVSEDLGGMQVFVKYNQIQGLIKELKKVLREIKHE